MNSIVRKWRLRRLGSFLLQEKAITKKELLSTLELQKKEKTRLGSLLVRLGLVPLDRMVYYLSEHLQVPYAHPEILENIEPDVIGLLPSSIAIRCKAIPVEVHKERLRVAMVDPFHKRHHKVISEATQLKLEPMIATELQIEEALKRYYPSASTQAES